MVKVKKEEIAKPTISLNKKKEEEQTYNYYLNWKNYENTEVYCPEGFELKKLGDICDVNPENKKIVPKYYVELGDVDNNCIINYTNYDESVPNAKKTVKINDILIATVRPKKTKCIIITNDINNKGGIDKIVFSTAFASLRIKDKKIDPVYVYNFIVNELDNFETKYCEGSTYPRFNAKILNDIQIPIPKDMSKIDPLIKKLHDIHNELTKMREKIPEKEKAVQNQIQEICDTEECDEYKLGDVCEMKCGSKINLQSYLVKKSDYKIIRTRNINENGGEYLYLDKNGIEKCKNSLLKENDILVSAFTDSYCCFYCPKRMGKFHI